MENFLKNELGYLNEYINFLNFNNVENLEFFKENITTMVVLNKSELLNYRNSLIN